MFEKVALVLPEEICLEFKRALQRGCWANDLPLTQQHKRTCEQALFYRQAEQLTHLHS